jgi:hypothetical protein
MIQRSNTRPIPRTSRLDFQIPMVLKYRQYEKTFDTG